MNKITKCVFLPVLWASRESVTQYIREIWLDFRVVGACQLKTSLVELYWIQFGNGLPSVSFIVEDISDPSVDHDIFIVNDPTDIGLAELIIIESSIKELFDAALSISIILLILRNN